jgi:hypothetical protein
MAPADIAEALRMLHELLQAQERVPEGIRQTISLKAAAYIAGITDSQMRRRCKQNATGTCGAEYGFKRSEDTDWSVLALPFLTSLPMRNVLRFKEVTKSQITWAEV